jgi:opacity protein-like surface antigen
MVRRVQRLFVCTGLMLALAVTITAIAPEVIVAVDAIPAHVAGRFREVRGFSQPAAGHYLIFDRRAHTVFGIDEPMSAAYTIVEIGAEPGRILGPTAFGVAADGSFVVADAPRGQGRVQLFSAAGQLRQQFLLPGPARTRLLIDGFAIGGVAGLHYSGASLFISQPEWGGLVTEFSLRGEPLRTFGQLRATGHESDPDVHLALNSGLVLAAPGGGCFFVFLAGEPIIRRYDAQGQLQFERHVQGQEMDTLVAGLPRQWPRDAGEQPMIVPVVRAAAVDPDGQLWISLRVPFTYVYDADGDKVRVVQFRAAGIVSPNSLTFGRGDRILVSPGLTIFDPKVISNLPADATLLEPVTLQPQPPSGAQR